MSANLRRYSVIYVKSVIIIVPPDFVISYKGRLALSERIQKDTSKKANEVKNEKKKKRARYSNWTPLKLYMQIAWKYRYIRYRARDQLI